MHNKQQQREVSDHVLEMAESAKEVKGEAFFHAVSAIFALRGIHDLSQRMAAALPEAEPYTDTIKALHLNVEHHIVAKLPEQHREEAKRLAGNMFERQRVLHENIARGA